MKFRVLSLFLLLAATMQAMAQTDAEKANALLQEGKFREAKAILAQLVQSNGENPANWMRLAFCRLSLNENREAVDAYKTAIAKGGPEGFARYNMACAYAKMGDKTNALNSIERACALGFGRAHMLRADEDFANIREEPRFKALLEKLSTPTKGLKGAEAMDLWVGEWTVFVNGQLAGTNSITRVLDGFAIEERWTSRSGGKGQSLFTFDRSRGEWKQLWVDDRGWIVEKVGVPIENGIRFEGWSYNADGTKQRARTTLSKNDDGSVRQLIEMQGPDGNWSPSFDGKYVRGKG